MFIDTAELGSLLECRTCYASPLSISKAFYSPGFHPGDYRLVMLPAGIFSVWCVACRGPDQPRCPQLWGEPLELLRRFGRIPDSAIPPISQLSFDDDLDTFRADCAAILAAGSLDTSLPKPQLPVPLGQKLVANPLEDTSLPPPDPAWLTPDPRRAWFLRGQGLRWWHGGT